MYVNGDYAGQHPNGYAPFRIALDPFLRYGEANDVRVEARAHRDSRWYSGLGIHRGVQLHVTEWSTSTAMVLASQRPTSTTSVPWWRSCIA